MCVAACRTIVLASAASATIPITSGLHKKNRRTNTMVFGQQRPTVTVRYKTDNEIRALYSERDNFLLPDQTLFNLPPITQVLAQTATVKEARLIGLKAAKRRWTQSQALEAADEDALNPSSNLLLLAQTHAPAFYIYYIVLTTPSVGQ